MNRVHARAFRLVVNNRRPRADSFPPDTPEPVADIDAAFTALLKRTRLWLCAFAVAAHLGLLLFLFCS